MDQTIETYRMNPAEDEIQFGDQLADDMWVLCEESYIRSPIGGSEDEKIRAQRFRRVTRLQRRGSIIVFVGEWADGYQEVHTYSVSYAWLVKKSAAADPPVTTELVDLK